MRERPILFSAPMVRAILEGRKTQTRRVVAQQPTFDRRGVTAAAWAERDGLWMFPNVAPEVRVRCPYGQPGDRLYVRETWGCSAADHPGVPDGRKPQPGDRIQYAANDSDAWQWRVPGSLPWRPSIHMPRWASRIDLEVTGVRVERLQDISAEDCIAEGMQSFLREHDAVCDLRDQFRVLWDSIHGKPAIERDSEGRGIARRMFDWAANPWVWVVEVRRIKPTTPEGDQ